MAKRAQWFLGVGGVFNVDNGEETNTLMSN
jgi:hypothetical protein